MAETLFPHQERNNSDPYLFYSSPSLQVSNPQCSPAINCNPWLLVAICFQLPPSGKSERLLPFFPPPLSDAKCVSKCSQCINCWPCKTPEKVSVALSQDWDGPNPTLLCLVWIPQHRQGFPPVKSSGLNAAGPPCCLLIPLLPGAAVLAESSPAPLESREVPPAPRAEVLPRDLGTCCPPSPEALHFKANMKQGSGLSWT